MDLPLVNNVTAQMVPLTSVYKLYRVLPDIIEMIASVPDNKDKIVFSEIGIGGW